jgi:hypothetical protein
MALLLEYRASTGRLEVLGACLAAFNTTPVLSALSFPLTAELVLADPPTADTRCASVGTCVIDLGPEALRSSSVDARVPSALWPSKSPHPD